MAPMLHWWLWTQFIYNTFGIRIGLIRVAKLSIFLTALRQFGAFFAQFVKRQFYLNPGRFEHLFNISPFLCTIYKRIYGFARHPQSWRFQVNSLVVAKPWIFQNALFHLIWKMRCRRSGKKNLTQNMTAHFFPLWCCLGPTPLWSQVQLQQVCASFCLSFFWFYSKTIFQFKLRISLATVQLQKLYVPLFVLILILF